MDGVSIAASLVGIGAAGCQIAIKLYTLATQITTASERISSISNDVSLTAGVLQQLGELMTQKADDDGTTIFSQSGLETTKTSAAMCQSIFREIEQAAAEASKQIRGNASRLVGGKVKLSKSEKAKWPFLQPSIENLRIDLREAKEDGGYVSVHPMAAVGNATDFRPSSHRTASTNIVEQREIISAILALQKQQKIEVNVRSKRLSVELPENRTPRSVSTLGRSRKTSSPTKAPALTPQIPSEREPTPKNPSPSPKIAPFRPHVMMAMPMQDFPQTVAQEDRSAQSLSRKISTENPRSEDTLTRASDSTPSLRGGTELTPSESTLNEEKHNSKALDLFLMKPVIQDLADIIQLSWKTHKIQMQQSQIEQQKRKNDSDGHESVFEIYQDLYAHENKRIEAEIANSGADASLVSLKRTFSDMWHREICFKGVPGLQFILERVVQRDSAGESRKAIDLEKPVELGAIEPKKRRSSSEYQNVLTNRKHTEKGIKAHSTDQDTRRTMPVQGSVPVDASSRPDPAIRTLRRKKPLGLALGTPAKDISSKAGNRTSPTSDQITGTSAPANVGKSPTTRENENSLERLRPVKYQEDRTQASKPADSKLAQAYKIAAAVDQDAPGRIEIEHKPTSISDKQPLTPATRARRNRTPPPALVPFRARRDTPYAPSKIERERKPYSSIPTESAIDDTDPTPVPASKPIERERKPYSPADRHPRGKPTFAGDPQSERDPSGSGAGLPPNQKAALKVELFSGGTRKESRYQRKPNRGVPEEKREEEMSLPFIGYTYKRFDAGRDEPAPSSAGPDKEKSKEGVNASDAAIRESMDRKDEVPPSSSLTTTLKPLGAADPEEAKREQETEAFSLDFVNEDGKEYTDLMSVLPDLDLSLDMDLGSPNVSKAPTEESTTTAKSRYAASRYASSFGTRRHRKAESRWSHIIDPDTRAALEEEDRSRAGALRYEQEQEQEAIAKKDKYRNDDAEPLLPSVDEQWKPTAEPDAGIYPLKEPMYGMVQDAGSPSRSPVSRESSIAQSVSPQDVKMTSEDNKDVEEPSDLMPGSLDQALQSDVDPRSANIPKDLLEHISALVRTQLQEASEKPKIQDPEAQSRLETSMDQRTGGRSVAAKKNKKTVEDEKYGGFDTEDSESPFFRDGKPTVEPHAGIVDSKRSSTPDTSKGEGSLVQGLVVGASSMPYFVRPQATSPLNIGTVDDAGLLPHIESKSLVDDLKQTQQDSSKTEQRSEADVELTSDDDDEDDDMEGEEEGVDEKEAERVVDELLGRYTTLYD
ncbi:MAG: hypothetical protein Q9174_002988 [Haloplaca sp. 1 TL-2023]